MENQPSIIKYPESNVVQLERQFFGNSEARNQAFEFDRLLKLLQRYKYLLMLLSGLGALAGYLVSTNETPMFRTSTRVVLQPESSNRSEFLNDRLRYYVPNSFYETQAVVIKSNVVLEKAARSLSPAMVNKMFSEPDKKWLTLYADDLRERVLSWLNLAGMDFGSGDKPDQAAQQSDRAFSVAVVVKKLNSSISVRFGKTTQLVNLSSVSSNPLVAAVSVNAVADAYIRYLVENRVSQTERAGQWLAEKIEESRERLTEAEDSLKEFQLKEQLFDLSTVESLSYKAIGTVDSALLEAEQSYATLSKRYGPKHPKLIEAKKKLLLAQQQYGSVSRKDLSSKDDRFELNKLERAINSNRVLYELFLSRFNEVELGIDSVSSNTKILERASIPPKPFSPNINKSTSKGAFIGLLIGIILLIAREFFDRTFKNQGEIEERLKLPVLGVLPLLTQGKFRKRPPALLPERHYHENSKSNFSEVVNHIRTGIIYSNVDSPPKVILVTSALPKEGKTTCATNLALAFSKIGKTLLMDADFRKPRIAQISNVDNAQGLTGYVVGQNSLQECLSQDPDSEDLFIMKSGEVPPNPLELLSSARFSKTLELMKKNFDYIVIDSAPIIPVSDGVVLGKLADAIILLVKAGRTTHQAAESALKRFSSASLKPVGVVLSQLDYRSSHYYYGKYEYYNREYYG